MPVRVPYQESPLLPAHLARAAQMLRGGFATRAQNPAIIAAIVRRMIDDRNRIAAQNIQAIREASRAKREAISGAIRGIGEDIKGVQKEKQRRDEIEEEREFKRKLEEQKAKAAKERAEIYANARSAEGPTSTKFQLQQEMDVREWYNRGAPADDIPDSIKSDVRAYLKGGLGKEPVDYAIDRINGTGPIWGRTQDERGGPLTQADVAAITAIEDLEAEVTQAQGSGDPKLIAEARAHVIDTVSGILVRHDADFDSEDRARAWGFVEGKYGEQGLIDLNAAIEAKMKPKGTPKAEPTAPPVGTKPSLGSIQKEAGLVGSVPAAIKRAGSAMSSSVERAGDRAIDILFGEGASQDTPEQLAKNARNARLQRTLASNDLASWYANTPRPSGVAMSPSERDRILQAVQWPTSQQQRLETLGAIPTMPWPSGPPAMQPINRLSQEEAIRLLDELKNYMAI